MEILNTLTQVGLICGFLYLIYFWMPEPFDKLFNGFKGMFGIVSEAGTTQVIEKDVITYV